MHEAAAATNAGGAYAHYHRPQCEASRSSLHWMEKVKADLDQDVHLGIIEPVPINTPTSWCSRMVIVLKSSGEPRRTVDIKALNDASVRQTHHIYSRWHKKLPEAQLNVC